jgi:hypothetical protein
MAYEQSFVLSVTNLLLYAPLVAVSVDICSTNLITNNLISYMSAIIILLGVSIFTLIILHQTTQLCKKLDTEQISVIIRTRKITSLFLYHTVYITPFERSIGTTRNAIIPREKVKFAPGLTLFINLSTRVGMLSCLGNIYFFILFFGYNWVNLLILFMESVALFVYDIIAYSTLNLQTFRDQNELTYAFYNVNCKYYLLIVLANWDVCFVTIEPTCDDKTENTTTEESKGLDNIVVVGNVPTAQFCIEAQIVPTDQLCPEAQIVPTVPYSHTITNTDISSNNVRNTRHIRFSNLYTYYEY